MKRLPLSLIIFITIISIVFLIGAKKETEKPVTIVMWWWGEQDEPGLENWLNETIMLYTEENPNVEIEAVLQATDQLIPAFQTAAEARSGPDIEFFWAGSYTMNNAFVGYLSPVSDYWTEEELDTYLAVGQELTYQDKSWTPSFYSTIASLAYNKDIFMEAGLDPENPPTRWDDFLVACEKIKTAGYVPLALGNSSFGGGHYAWLEGPLGGQNLDSLQDYLAQFIGKADPRDNKYTEWLYVLEDFWKKGYINDDVNSLGITQAWEDYFASGKSAMTIIAGGAYRSYIEDLGMNLGIMKVPVYGTGKVAGKANVWRKNFGITDWSENKEVTADFLKFMASEERANAMYEQCGAFSGSKLLDPSIIKDEIGQDLYENLQYSWDGVTNAVTPPFIDAEGYWVAVQKIFANEYTAEQAIDHIVDVINRWQVNNPELFESYKKWGETMKEM
jgi:multiple sugar transport system substrate-binding protein